MKRISIAIFAFIVGGGMAFAASRETSVLQAKSIYVEYFNPTLKRKSAPVRVKDLQTGSSAQLQLLAVPKRPGLYSGSFVIQFVRGDQSAKVLEFYEPSGKEIFVFSGSSSPVQVVNLFKNEADWAKFAKSYKPTSTSGSAEPKKSIEQRKVEVRLQEQSQEQTRLKIEQDEALKRERARVAQEALSAAQKAKVAQTAKNLLAQGDRAYKAEKYEAAEEYYEKASALDASNAASYFQYGVTLYKVGKYNRSLAVLSLAEGANVNSNERDYYIALNHMKLQEYDKARKGFVEIREEQDPQLSPMASYFAGNIEYQTAKYPEARKSLEYVIDNSQDPQLDKLAETLLEEVDRAENFANSLKERFRFTLYAGPGYDGNVLNVATNNIATDVAAYRLSYGASAQGWWYRTMKSDLSTILAVSDIYSLNSKFQGDAVLQTADPLEISASVPWRGQFEAKGKAYAWSLTPAYKTLRMAPSGGSRVEILTTTQAGMDLSWAWSAQSISKVRLDFSSDTSKLVATTPEDDQSGSHTTLTWYQTMIMDLKGTKSWTFDVAYNNNAMAGANNRSTKTTLGVTYGFPMKQWFGSARLDYAQQKYAEAATPRTDGILTATFGASKDLTKSLNLAFNAQYMNSSSDVDAYKYSKPAVSATLTHITSILQK